MTHPIIISLEGNIGAGKSTFLEHLEKTLGNNSEWIFLREPVHIWDQIRDENGETMLSKFYANPEKYAFAFQVMAYTTRYQELKRIIQEYPNCKGILCERSLEADKFIFAKMLHSDGLIDNVMYTIYEKYFSVYEGNFNLDGIIHIHANPETCFDRIEKRSRNGENSITLDYLKNCDTYHNEWLSNTTTQVLTLDVNSNVNVNISDTDTNIQLWLNKAVQFIEMFSKDKIKNQATNMNNICSQNEC